ncbi:hypothetical protein DFH07DRAFT_813179 [Mycena maculata]|uniref:Mitochondrial carrier n=1 Tax=Mycena maculata TaxID=230809 RepID=A0AAD7JIJ7_9AGAR|nr:hypothetical protein DFH07DRAFT_813179 [Mycena maculata]
MPSILTSLINFLAHSCFWSLGPSAPLTDAVLGPPLALLLIPLHTLTTRSVPRSSYINLNLIYSAITTPHALSAFAPRAALCALLSPAERAAPWRLYQAPGVALAALLAAAVPALAPRPLAAALAPTLNVLTTRLALQRQGPDEDIHSGKGTADAVLAVRSRAPYTSLADCARKIVREEGVGALFRAWEHEALKFIFS